MSNYIPCHRKLCTTFSKSFSSCSSRSALFKMYGVVVPFLKFNKYQQQQQESCNTEKMNMIRLFFFDAFSEKKQTSNQQVNLAQDNKKGKKRSIALLGNVHIVVKRKKMQATTKKQNKNCFFVLLLEKKSHLSVSI
ncbi:hypothetical protein T02_8712 [Trichinella nativa]|uniref:Uncharacterized protein n=1 Tax=Trichinella nativa TaxID=6335 RepID=A0A0V1KSR9_9BILA|nr:hypothetical protein T02_8712 [Trichinella nativa]